MTDYDYIKRETAARREYETYWESYLNGNLESFASTLDDNYEMIGTSEGEVAHNKAEGIAFFKSQMQEMVGKAEMRNRKISTKPMNGMFLINENCDILVLTGTGWSFYSKIRISTFLHETQLGWKVIQQHGSLPDMRVQNGETLAIEKIGRENIELRDAIKRATTELEYKNRELEIEAALERVRSKSLAMQRSDELEQVIACVFEMIVGLGIAIEGALLYVFNRESRNINLWIASVHFTNPVLIDLPFEEEMLNNEIISELWKSTDNGQSLNRVYSGEGKNDYFRYVQRHNSSKFLEQTDLPDWSFSFAAEKNSILGVDSWQGHTFTESDLKLLRRFAKVFEQAYIRFLDLQKAEAQAREAQIEAALERVRSRSLAMHTSSDLSAVVYEMFTELVRLDAQLDRCLIMIVNPETLGITWYLTGKEGLLSNNGFLVQNNPHPSHQAYLEGWRTKRKKWHYFLAGEEKREWDEFGFTRTGLALLPDFIKADMASVEAIHLTISSNDFGCLIASSISPLSETHAGIVDRFTTVFNQTYTRFLDLQKAEVQAREAQIQLSLERIRAKAMSMQHSDELSGFLTVLFEQFNVLNLNPVFCHLSLFDIDNNRTTFRTTGKNGATLFATQEIDYDASPFWKQTIENWKAGHPNDVGVMYIPYESIHEVADIFKEIRSKLPEDVLPQPEDFPDGQYVLEGFCKYGYLGYSASSPPSEEDKEITRRIANEFGNVYQRFIDLQKAEAQAREAEIEVALEKVRSRSLAMHKSEELKEVVFSVFERLRELQIQTDSTNIIVYFDESVKMELWTANNMNYHTKFTLPMNEGFYPEDGIVARKEQKVYLRHLPIEEKNRFWNELFNTTEFGKVPEARKNFLLEKTDCLIQMAAFGKVTSIMLLRYFNIPFSGAEIEITERFAKVFDQAYTRFLDLQKAEEQARESQIQLSLERIRAKAMAMQHSDELSDFLTVVFEQFHVLNLHPVNSQISFLDLDNNRSIFRLTGKNGATLIATQEVDLDASPVWKQKVEDFKSGHPNDVDVLYIPFDMLPQIGEIFKEILAKLPEDERPLPEDYPNGQYIIEGTFKYGYLGYSASKPPSEEDKEITRRIANEFGNVYQRFLDLQKAEAQAREAQIQLSLERVRARTMAMQKSDELAEVSYLLNKQVVELGIPTRGCAFNIYNEHDSTEWFSNLEGTLPPYQTPREYIFQNYYEAGQRGETLLIEEFGGDRIKELYQYFASRNNSGNEAIDNHLAKAPDYQINHMAYFKYGYLLFITLAPAPEAHDVFKRFAKEFEQTYTRFLDLQKAEAQAREAQIEAALERVRSKAMAMHSSEDLAAAIRVFYLEMKGLSVTPRRLGVGLVSGKNRIAEISSMNTTEQGESVEVIGKLEMSGHPVLDGIYDHWLLQKEYHPVLRGNEIREYYSLIRPHIAYPDYPTDAVQFGYFFPFTEGSIYAWTEQELHEDELKIYRKFTTVLSLTYKRYKDLKDTEANALEAVRRASLDRVRAEIASMRTVDDLQRITPIIWHELTALGVPFVRCGVFIIDESAEHIQVHLSAPDGRSLGLLDLPFDSSELTVNSVNHWRQGIIFKTHWNKQEFLNFMQSMIKLGQISNQETYQGATQPPESLNLHFVPFKQGMLYVGNISPLEKEALELVKSLAESFSIAYARYEDFKNLEEAKNKIEITLSELKSTQAQLVQQEKLASLGQLTAGIAHEIKNPLNFVNNFSEVSMEMIEEVLDSRLKTQDTRHKTESDEIEDEILEDIKANLKKIHEHGSRANGIVTSMLQHSRGGSGKKEPTDLNALIKEYVNLSFHGMRAGKKPIDVEVVLDLDEAVKEVSLVREDFTRVIINLCNNAFDAMREKVLKTQDARFKIQDGDFGNVRYIPKLRVTTTLENGQIKISFEDNGPGIPDEIKDKILQPFFTTKKGTEGTGLGLSITHDIVKAHGGSISISSDANGSIFTLTLPKNE